MFTTIDQAADRLADKIAGALFSFMEMRSFNIEFRHLMEGLDLARERYKKKDPTFIVIAAASARQIRTLITNYPDHELSPWACSELARAKNLCWALRVLWELEVKPKVTTTQWGDLQKLANTFNLELRV